MRITNSMLSQNYLNNLNKNMNTLNKYQTQVATNKRITKLSDDPIGAIATLSVRTKINKLAQHKRNVDDAKSWLTQSETSLMEINEVVKSAYEQTVSASTDTMSDSDRNATVQYIEQLRGHLIQVGNATLGNRYLFGGYNTTKAPFTLDENNKVLYNGVDLLSADSETIEKHRLQNIEYEIGTGINTKVSFTGIDLFGNGENNLFYILDNLIDTIKSGGTGEQIGQFVGKLQQKQEDVLVQITEIGGRMKRLELVADRYSLDAFNYETIKSNVEDADIAEVIMRLQMSEASYNTALAVGTRILQPTLADFMR